MKIRISYQDKSVPCEDISLIMDIVRRMIAERGMRIGNMTIYADVYGADGYKTELYDESEENQLGLLVRQVPYKRSSREPAFQVTDPETGEAQLFAYWTKNKPSFYEG